MTISILSVADIRAAEEAADAAGITYATMMERAGQAIADRLSTLLAESDIPAAEWRVTFLIGPGNNGGDGLVAGRVLAAETSAQVRLYLLRPRQRDDSLLRPALDAGLLTVVASDDPEFHRLREIVRTSQIVVDALFGIGARLPLDEAAQHLLDTVREIISDAQADKTQPAVLTNQRTHLSARPCVLAVDCPSGLDCETGALDAASVPAEETITMIAAKPGLLRFPGANAVGRLLVADLGLADFAPQPKHLNCLFTADDAAARLPTRRPDSHKGSFGHVLIAGGSASYPGAPALAARAAYRTGAGLVTAAVPSPLAGWLAGSLPEAVWLHLPDHSGALTAEAAPLLREQAAQAQVLVLGMGLGRAPATAQFLLTLFSDDAQSSPPLPPLVLDADGLSLLAALPDWPQRLPPDSILTPHPGEMARLCRTSTQEVLANRWALAREKAAEWNSVVVLKGAHTVIASPNGQLRVLPFKTSALATAGTGDVLAGMIGTLRAQGLTDFDAAAVGAFLHGMAGEQAARSAGSERGVCASDVIAALPTVFRLIGR